MADTYEAGSPLWWLNRLYGRLMARRDTLERLAQYYDGIHPLAFQSKKFREAFGGLFKEFADNWCGIVVGACEERLNVTGFRVNAQPAADRDAWRLWQANEMDLQSEMLHAEALTLGQSYATVWVGDEPGVPEITADSAISTIVATHPKQRRRRLAGLRTYCDDAGYDHAELFLPDAVYLYRTPTPRSAGMPLIPEQTRWVPDTDEPEQTNPLGVVPIVEFKNRPRLYIARAAGCAAHSELTPIIPLQDAANKIIADMLLASEFAAFPQRWITGYEDGSDQARANFKSGPGNTWVAENDAAKFGQFQAAELNNYVTAIEMIVQHIASISATPPHYLRASADRLSGESLKSAETGLVAKVRRRQVAFAEPWEQVMRLAGQLAGNSGLASAESMETIWSDPESRTEGEHVDAAVKKAAIGVPAPQLWEDLGYTPQQIQRFKAMQAGNALLAAVANPTQPPALSVAGGGNAAPPAA